MIRRSLAVLGTAAAAAAIVPSVAAATQMASLDQTNPIQSSSVSIGGYGINGGINDIALLDLDVSAKAQWKGNLWTTVGWNDDLRQGGKVTVNRATNVQTGTMHVTWNVSGRVNPLDTGYLNIGTMSVSDDANCSPSVVAGNFDCVAESPSLNVVNTPGIPLSPYVKLVLRARFTVTGEGTIIKRTFSTVGGPSSSLSGLGIGLIAQSETLDLPCDPTGADVNYAINSIHYTPAVAVSQQPYIQAGLRDPLGWSEMPAVYDGAFGPAVKTAPSFDLSGSGPVTKLGTLKYNNVPPTVSLASTFSGSAGAPIQFSVNATGRCGLTYYWKFDDGAYATTANPQHTFTTKGMHYGTLSVVDYAGNKVDRDFAVSVG